MPRTKEQKAAYSKEYYQQNKEQKAAYSKEYYQQNKEKQMAYAKEYYKQNKEKIKEYYANRKEQTAAYYRDKRYKLSTEDYYGMLEKQENKCKLCFMEFNTDDTKVTSPCVDHCHTTDKIRGLLCRRCNMGLGYFKDNTVTVTRAINYLQENR